VTTDVRAVNDKSQQSNAASSSTTATSTPSWLPLKIRIKIDAEKQDIYTDENVNDVTAAEDTGNTTAIYELTVINSMNMNDEY
jgi:hypothetical protein